jgi:hypothetical protein
MIAPDGGGGKGFVCGKKRHEISRKTPGCDTSDRGNHGFVKAIIMPPKF